MPSYTVCYTLTVEGTITVQAENLDDAKERVEKTPFADILKDGSEDFGTIDAVDGWETE